MCAISRLVFACSIIALCGVVSETNVTLSGQDLQGGDNITRETNNSLNQPQLKDPFSKSRSTFYGSISDILRFNPRLTIGAEVSGEVTNQSGYNISEASSGPKQYYHDQDSRIGYNVLESLYPRPVNPNRRKRIRGRRRREARIDQTALTAESTPSVKILVRVRRKQTRRADFTQLNKGNVDSGSEEGKHLYYPILLTSRVLTLGSVIASLKPIERDSLSVSSTLCEECMPRHE